MNGIWAQDSKVLKGIRLVKCKEPENFGSQALIPNDVGCFREVKCFRRYEWNEN